MSTTLHGSIGFWLKKNFRNACNYLDQRLEEQGVTNSQLGVLIILWEQEGLTQKDMVQILGIQPASMTFLLRGLEVKNMISRVQDKVDTRINRIYVTEKGLSIKQACLAIVEEGEKMIRQGFSEQEIALMLHWMKRVDSNFHE
ncbi:MarR family winged helix-turn-helix transcriptional regulator [Paenibacillus alba]|uniref:MarR family transcriptional regulator n=1 Tax=Paenibacillus alba TaxID=1197127 RepID=A0ABU6GEB8_9BACL|nr:MarR family transcriptional regulator [Paenibacillus alba]MEC0231024.1 MarR family transcriptional regulator [Paenibacillus alba]NQX69830.1 MarR family transcriptional regulator [Paenibacillus alba]